MNEIIREKYSEAISQKQKSINDYQLAIQNLMKAFNKRNHLNEKNDAHTIIDIHRLQKKKINLEKESSPFHSEVLNLNQSTQKIMDTLMMKEWILYKNIDLILTIIEKMDDIN